MADDDAQQGQVQVRAHGRPPTAAAAAAERGCCCCPARRRRLALVPAVGGPDGAQPGALGEPESTEEAAPHGGEEGQGAKFW